jgi:hypothetical protein
MGEVKNLYDILVGKPEGERPLGRHRPRREDTGMGFRENRFGGCGLDSSGSG